jgi:hypothetical protein
VSSRKRKDEGARTSSGRSLAGEGGETLRTQSVGRKRKAEVEDLKLEVSGFIYALKKALHYLPLFGKKKLIDARSMNLLFSREGD